MPTTAWHCMSQSEQGWLYNIIIADDAHLTGIYAHATIGDILLYNIERGVGEWSLGNSTASNEQHQKPALHYAQTTLHSFRPKSQQQVTLFQLRNS